MTLQVTLLPEVAVVAFCISITPLEKDWVSEEDLIVWLEPAVIEKLLVSANKPMTCELFLVVVMVAEAELAPPLLVVFVAPVAPEPFVPEVSAPE